ncbi:Gfo/Idh/MocA family oxidoreductase [Streptomyces sp. NBC_00597]|uniref:Gfo/Idh/MocA family oxidoreductase n=1 Tax=Streptomyces sp. NBC_00597 TaxID=2975786 RepID=UPI00352F81BA
MRIGVIGTGRIGSFHAAALARQPDAGSLLLADADPARAARVADRLGATAAPSVEQVFTGQMLPAWGCATDARHVGDLVAGAGAGC